MIPTHHWFSTVFTRAFLRDWDNKGKHCHQVTLTTNHQQMRIGGEKSGWETSLRKTNFLFFFIEIKALIWFPLCSTLSVPHSCPVLRLCCSQCQDVPLLLWKSEDGDDGEGEGGDGEGEGGNGEGGNGEGGDQDEKDQICLEWTWAPCRPVSLLPSHPLPGKAFWFSFTG